MSLRQSKYFTTAREEVLRLRYPSEGPEILAQEWGLTKKQVVDKAYWMGVKSLNAHKRGGDTLSKLLRERDKGSVDYKYFDVWSPNTAYILGYIWADGSIEECDKIKRRGAALRLCCVKRDEGLLLQIKAELKSLHKITSFYKKDREYVRVTIAGIRLVESLKCHGLEVGKSKKDLSFPKVPENLLCHFCRGNLDGDGSVGKFDKPRVNWIGSPKFLIILQKRIGEACKIPVNTIEKHGKTLRCNWYSKEHLRKIYKWLYPEGDYIYLPRKKRRLEILIGKRVQLQLPAREKGISKG